MNTNSDFDYLDKTISGKIKYYNNLSVPGKRKFCNRVIEYIEGKEFEGMDDFVVTDEVKILIGAAAVQLTFGLNDFSLGGHHCFRIYPATFYNTSNGDKYKGLTLQKNLIALSWEDFEHGYFIEDDHYNLGLHEMAHVLRLSVNTDDFDQNFAGYLNDWDNKAGVEFERMQQFPDQSFLRNYAATNMSEFFSVCVEYFFEVPDKFKNNLTDIYNYLCILLNQDPLNKTNDYRMQAIDEIMADVQSNDSTEKKYLLHKEWPLYVDTFIVIGFFTGLLCFWFFVYRMKINFGTFCMICGYSFFSLLIITQLIRTSLTMRKIDPIDIMRMILISPFITLSVFTINFISKGEMVTEQYTIIGFNIHNINNKTDKVELTLENDNLESFPKLRIFETENNTYEWQKVSYDFEIGIFGFRNLISRSIILKDGSQIKY